jgi:hypothetical protein
MHTHLHHSVSYTYAYTSPLLQDRHRQNAVQLFVSHVVRVLYALAVCMTEQFPTSSTFSIYFNFPCLDVHC